MIWWGALAAHYLAALYLTGGILRRRMEPVAMLAWILALWTLPWIGLLAYGLLGTNRIRRRARRRRRRVASALAEFRQRAQDQTLPQSGPEQLAERWRGVEQLGRRLTDVPAVGGNDVLVYHRPRAMFDALEQAIQSAQQHVHLLYYIWRPDDTGRRFRDLLIRKAQEGVKCRLLLDAVGSLAIGRRFTEPLIEAGVKVAFYLPLWRFRRMWSLHLRNHRKIAVIDAETAFIGSQNIGDEYLGRHERLTPWHDCQLRIRGPAALFLQQVFAEDWLFAAREDLDREVYFPTPPAAGDSIVQVLATGPQQDESVLGQLLFAALSEARQTIRIATPYFVPDAALRMALVHAAWRGVRVQVVLTTQSDVPITLWAARSYYGELVDAGVEVYEFYDGVLHSKLLTVDDEWGMAGSANMDVRSFRLNLEASALVYDAQLARRLSELAEQHIRAARRITARDVWNRTRTEQVLYGIARILGPLL